MAFLAINSLLLHLGPSIQVVVVVVVSKTAAPAS
jgi:hypothetical protein